MIVYVKVCSCGLRGTGHCSTRMGDGGAPRARLQSIVHTSDRHTVMLMAHVHSLAPVGTGTAAAAAARCCCCCSYAFHAAPGKKAKA